MDLSDNIGRFLKSLNLNNFSFEEVDFSDINARNSEGENALHASIIAGERDISIELVDAGIDIHARGDLGRTPLHYAASYTDLNLVKYLVQKGADVHALDEGIPAFTLARYSKADEICSYLGEQMELNSDKDDKVWINARISSLEYEIERLKRLL